MQNKGYMQISGLAKTGRLTANISEYYPLNNISSIILASVLTPGAANA
jgi:hypothetical protein